MEVRGVAVVDHERRVSDFMLYGISNVGNLMGTVTDPLLELVPGAIAGGVIAAVLAKVR